MRNGVILKWRLSLAGSNPRIRADHANGTLRTAFFLESYMYIACEYVGTRFIHCCVLLMVGVLVILNVIPQEVTQENIGKLHTWIHIKLRISLKQNNTGMLYFALHLSTLLVRNIDIFWNTLHLKLLACSYVDGYIYWIIEWIIDSRCTGWFWP